MRTFTLFLMLALLPVRIWAADDMAFSMAKMAAGASVLQDAQSLRSQTSNIPEDCPMMAMNQADHGDDPDGRSVVNCTACQLCAPTAAQSELSVASCPVPPRLTAVPVWLYANTSIALDLRPPIS